MLSSPKQLSFFSALAPLPNHSIHPHSIETTVDSAETNNSFPQTSGDISQSSAPAWSQDPHETHPILAVEIHPHGPRVLVHPLHGCSCGASLSDPCWHLKRALAVWEDGPSGLRYLAKSGFHKELRRGDLQAAFRWARLAAHFHGRSWPKSYLKRVLLEESRSISLLHQWKSLAGLNWEDCVQKGIAAPKKWQVPRREGLFAEYVEAFVATENDPIFSSFEQVQQAVDLAQDRDDLWRIFWRAMRRRDRFGVTWQIDAMKERAFSKSPTARLFVEEALWDTNPFYGPKVLIELLTDAWDQTADQLDPRVLQQALPNDEHLVIPAAPAYLYDCHEISGQRRLLKHWDAILPHQPMPKGVDLRWSGMLAGVCWREYAARQSPHRLRQCPWEAVDIPREVWQHATICDRFFYPRFYQQLPHPSAQAA
ncbi:hypothetical protein L6R29_24120 [Myxococcota bacterium]|nr:hypothetical protein [Myxococcota bacterium]